MTGNWGNLDVANLSFDLFVLCQINLHLQKIKNEKVSEALCNLGHTIEDKISHNGKWDIHITLNVWFYRHLLSFIFLTIKTQFYFKRLPSCTCPSHDSLVLWDDHLLRREAGSMTQSSRWQTKPCRTKLCLLLVHLWLLLLQWQNRVLLKTVWSIKLRYFPSGTLQEKVHQPLVQRFEPGDQVTSSGAIYFVTLYN